MQDLLVEILSVLRAEKGLQPVDSVLSRAFGDLGIDSLDLVEVCAALEGRTGCECPAAVYEQLTVHMRATDLLGLWTGPAK